MDSLTVGLDANSTKSIMTTNKPVIKDIKKRLGNLIEPNDTASYRLYYGLQTMQYIDFLDIEVQDLANRGLQEDAMLLQSINADCAKLCKSVQRHLTQTKTKSDEYRLIYLPKLKRNTMPNLTHSSDWLRIVESTLDESNYFHGSSIFSYVVREV